MHEAWRYVTHSQKVLMKKPGLWRPGKPQPRKPEASPASYQSGGNWHGVQFLGLGFSHEFDQLVSF